MIVAVGNPASRPPSQGVPLLRAEAGLTQDGAHDGDGNIAGVHRDRDTATVGVRVPGVASDLPPEGEPGPLELSDDLPCPERPKAALINKVLNLSPHTGMMAKHEAGRAAAAAEVRCGVADVG